MNNSKNERFDKVIELLSGIERNTKLLVDCPEIP